MIVNRNHFLRQYKIQDDNQTYTNGLFQQNRKKFLNGKRQYNFSEIQENISKIKRQKSNPQQNLKQIKSYITVNTLIKGQQPQNFIKSQRKNKHNLMISSKQKYINPEMDKDLSHKSISQRNLIGQTLFENNNNKKTRKYIHSPTDYFEKTDNNTKNEYYGEQDFKELRKQKTLKYINLQKDQKQKKKSPCNHKSKKKQKQQMKSLINIQNRISFCEAYIDLSEKKTDFLAKQIDYLLNKQFLRESKKYHRKHQENLNHYFSQRNVEVKKIEPLNLVQNEQKYKRRQKCSHKSRKQVVNQTQKNVESRNKFHFRSSQKVSSKMKSLIYFHQRQNNSQIGKNDENSHKKSIKNSKKQKTSDKIKNQQTSIYQDWPIQHQKKEKQDINFLQKQRICQKSSLQLKQNTTKSIIKTYEEKQSYLLLEDDGDDYQIHTNGQYQKNRINRKLPGEEIVPYVHSQILPNQQEEPNQNLSEQEENAEEIIKDNYYLTKQFELFSPKNMPKSPLKSPQNKSRTKMNQMQGFKSQKILPQRISLQKNQSQRVKQSKLSQVNLNSNKSSQNFNQKQYTFLKHEQNFNRLDQLSSYQIIESNLNSPENINKNISSSISKESQLIDQFNELLGDGPSRNNERKQKKYMTSQRDDYRTNHSNRIKSQLKHYIS